MTRGTMIIAYLIFCVLFIAVCGIMIFREIGQEYDDRKYDEE